MDVDQQPSRHSRKNCPAYRLTYCSCGKIGHVGKAVQANCKLREEYDNSADLNPTIVASVSTNDSGHERFLPVSINGKKKIDMLIDSGSDLTMVDITTANRRLLSFKPPHKLSPKILGANNTSLDMVGIIQNACLETLNGYLVDTVWVAKNLTSEAILGQRQPISFPSINF